MVFKCFYASGQKKRSNLADLACIELGEELATALDHLIAVDGVKHLLALLAAGHQAEPLENVQVVGDSRLGHIEGGHDITDAHLPLLQHLQYLLPGIVGQSLAKVHTVNHYRSLPQANRWF